MSANSSRDDPGYDESIDRRGLRFDRFPTPQVSGPAAILVQDLGTRTSGNAAR